MIPYSFLLIPVLVLLISVGLRIWRQRHKRALQQRLDFIRQYQFPAALFGKMRQHIPALEQDGYQEICAGLRHFFMACCAAPGQNLEMPSQAVDLLWHEFILFTRNYEQFCQQAFGRFLHHMPAGSAAGAQGNILPSWRSACAAENINPQQPDRLPSLFALDSRLGLAAPILWTLAAGSLMRSSMDGHSYQYSLAQGYGGAGLDGFGGMDFTSSFGDSSDSGNDGASCSSDSSCSSSGCSGSSD